MSSDAPLIAQDLKDDLEVLLQLADQLGLTVVGALLASAIDVIPIVKH
jgi:mannose/fructose/N-acetylgalactosamine-specific phosphotransferase system component IID